MPFATKLSIAFISLFLSTAHAQTPVESWQAVSIPDAAPVLMAIAYAESGGEQYWPNGKLKCDGVTGTHCGIFQLSKELRRQAKEMGIDADTPEGNIKFAMDVYKLRGTSPWLASEFDKTNPNAWGQWFNADGTYKVGAGG